MTSRSEIPSVATNTKRVTTRNDGYVAQVAVAGVVPRSPEGRFVHCMFCPFFKRSWCIVFEPVFENLIFQTCFIPYWSILCICLISLSLDMWWYWNVSLAKCFVSFWDLSVDRENVIRPPKTPPLAEFHGIGTYKTSMKNITLQAMHHLRQPEGIEKKKNLFWWSQDTFDSLADRFSFSRDPKDSIPMM